MWLSCAVSSVTVLDTALADGLAGCQQFASGALGKGLHPHRRQHLVRDA